MLGLVKHTTFGIKNKKPLVATLFNVFDNILHRGARAGKLSKGSDPFLVTWQVNIEEHTISDFYCKEIVVIFIEERFQ